MIPFVVAADADADADAQGKKKKKRNNYLVQIPQNPSGERIQGGRKRKRMKSLECIDGKGVEGNSMVDS